MRTMAHVVTPGGTQPMPPGRARHAATLSTSLATGVAVLTVLMSPLADRVGDDPLAFAERRLPAWLTVGRLGSCRTHHRRPVGDPS